MIKNFSVTLGLLSNREKAKLALAVVLQVVLALLDLVALASFSILANLIITRNLYIPYEPLRDFFERHQILLSKSIEMNILILALFIFSLFIIRSFGTAIYISRLFGFLASKDSSVAMKIAQNVLLSDSKLIDAKNIQEWLTVTTRGISALIMKQLGGALAALTDVSLLIILSIGLLVYDWISAITAIMVFGLAFVILNVTSRKRIYHLSKTDQERDRKFRVLFSELFMNYRDFRFNGDIQKLTGALRLQHKEYTRVNAKISIIPMINRYYYEASLLICLLIFGIVVFIRFEENVALSAIATFVVASTRIVPSMIRLQQFISSVSSARSYIELAVSAIKEIETAHEKNQGILEEVTPGQIIQGDKFIEFKDGHFSIGEKQILKGVNLEISFGEKVAIFGTSGAGKSTILDLIAGVKRLTAGKIYVLGKESSKGISYSKGVVGYVPQDVGLLTGSVRENILLGRSGISDEQIIETLRKLNLSRLFDSLSNGLDSFIGDGVRKLSGGEKQRIGVARAIIGNPKILLLDEFTSALDPETESKVIDETMSISKEMTVVLVTHSRDAIKNFGKILNIRDGLIDYAD